MEDNPTPEMDNLDPESGSVATETPEVSSFSWKNNLSADLKNSPLMQKFDDDVEGLNKAMTSHANLERLLGHDKVPIPKGPEDMEGWSRFSKALGIPDKAEGYGLPDSALPENVREGLIDKQRFAEIVHAHKLTPSQANGLWKVYNEITAENYQKNIENFQSGMNETVNRLKGEWGDAYETNVQLGQTVINKFSDTKEMNDYLTATLSQDPMGIKFLAKIGSQFAENKIGEFQMSNYSQTPDQMQEEIDKMVMDLEGPYMNQKGKFTEREHQAAIDRVNMMRAAINRTKGQA